MARARLLRTLIGTGLVLALVAGGGAGGQAGDRNSKVTIRYRSRTFSGRVTSSLERCVAYRQVKLMKKRATGNQVETSVPTDANGDWIVFADRGTRGNFFAVVMVSDDGCDRDRSRTIHV